MRKQVPNQEQIVEALDLASMGLTAEQAYRIGRLTGDMISSAFALGRVAAAQDIDCMPYELGDEGWGDLERQAVDAGYDASIIRRRRRGDLTTTTIEAAYQYGYRQASKVARGVTRPNSSEAEEATK